jgi:hypothetical protein
VDDTLAMLIIFGTRHYGVVDRHAGQYACTRVFHVYYLPIIPLGTMWVTAEHGDALSGHKVAFYGRSIAAAFLRPWGIAVGIIGGLAGIRELDNGRIGSGVGLLVVAAMLLALAIRSFRQRTVRGVRAIRERDLARAVFGTACDPKYLPRSVVDAMQSSIENDWARVAQGRTPGDVARLGPSSPDQALLAWALLRLRARTTPGAERARLLADAARIADGVHDSAQLGSPYRELPRGLERVSA